ncbi:MAG: glycine/sarcosine/betaine reductase selenoprotein B family protein [Desulfoplanes sp.]|nr:glycine/sarcosine/betaine reductase selenoprotein B family protein [Desulfoplanes sp.]
MDIFKKTKIWRRLGKLLDTRIGSSMVEAIAQPLNILSSLAVATHNDTIPWTPFTKPLGESCLALVSTAGFYMEGDIPFDVDSARGDASFRIIPSDCDKKKLKIAHTHYAHTRVEEDINVLFPLDRLHELVEAGVIGTLSPHFYSFGFGGNLTKEFIGGADGSTGSAQELVQKLKAEDVDCVLMVPA